MPYKVTEINASKTALIIVDMENDFVAEGAPGAGQDGAGSRPAAQAGAGSCSQHRHARYLHYPRPPARWLRHGSVWQSVAANRG